MNYWVSALAYSKEGLIDKLFTTESSLDMIAVADIIKCWSLDYVIVSVTITTDQIIVFNNSFIPMLSLDVKSEDSLKKNKKFVNEYQLALRSLQHICADEIRKGPKTTADIMSLNYILSQVLLGKL